MLGYFPEIYPDELLYSALARQRERLRHPSALATGREFFADAYARAAVDLPAYLSAFVSRLPNGHPHTVDSLIDRHTMFPFYSHFLPPKRVATVRRLMQASDARAIRRRVPALMASPRRDLLRYCSRCVVNDRAWFGETYWHRSHQLPGIDTCPTHANWLVEVPGAQVFEEAASVYRTAETMVPLDVSDVGVATCDDRVRLQLANDACWLLINPSNGNEQPMFGRRFTELLTDRSLMLSRGRVNARSLLRRFRAEIPHAVLESLGAMPSDRNTSWLLRIVRCTTSPQHPIRYMLLMAFLGCDAATFFASPQAFRPLNGGPLPCRNPASGHAGEHCAWLSGELGEKAATQREREREIRCDCGFAYVASDDDSDDSRRPYRIIETGQAWDRLFSELYLGAVAVSAIARRFDLSRSEVIRHARRLGLPERPRRGYGILRCRGQEPRPDGEDRFAAKRDAKRRMWLELRAMHPDWSRNTLRLHAVALYAWLRRDNSSWLEANLPAPAFGAAVPKGRLEKRDYYRAKVLAILEADHGATRQSIYERMPAGLNWLRKYDREWVEDRIPRAQLGPVGSPAFETLRQTHRRAWTDTRLANPTAGRVALRGLASASYGWLSRNDKEWLAANSPVRGNPPGRSAWHDWPEIDARLAREADRAARELLERGGEPVRLTKAGIRRALGLKPSYGDRFEKLPITAARLEALAESHEDYITRRLRWHASELERKGCEATPDRLRERVYVSPQALQSERVRAALANGPLDTSPVYGTPPKRRVGGD